MKVTYTIMALLAATALLLSAAKFLPAIPLSLHGNAFANNLLKYQLFAVVVAGAALLLTLAYTPESRVLLRFGNMETIAAKEQWLGINGKSTWRANGLQLLLFISLATGVFMFLAVKYTGSLNNFNWQFVPLVILISLANSFSEEILYRFAINGNLTGHASKTIVFVVSAVLFGLPHYAGFPNGIAGVIMAGVLGYILSKATYETQGLGLAWGIHFVQDLIIITAIFMMKYANG